MNILEKIKNALTFIMSIVLRLMQIFGLLLAGYVLGVNESKIFERLVTFCLVLSIIATILLIFYIIIQIIIKIKNKK